MSKMTHHIRDLIEAGACPSMLGHKAHEILDYVELHEGQKDWWAITRRFNWHKATSRELEIIYYWEKTA